MTEHERIDQIEQSLIGLEKQLYSLKAELRDLKQANATDSAVDEIVTVSDTVQAESVSSITSDTSASDISSVAPSTASAAPARAISTAARQTPPLDNNKKTASRFEDNLGGKVMGIVAAVLVFIGLLLFGSMLYERLGDTARVAILFIASFLILGAGLFLERKRRSRFTTSLIGCGFGAVYISLFISALYYQMFGKEVLYILLFLWLISIGLYVFHQHSCTVALLGQIGIAFSVIFGCLGVDSKGLFTFLCFYFTLLSLLYLWVVLGRFLPDMQKKPLTWLSLTAVSLNLLQLWVMASRYDSLFGKWGELGGKNWTAGILLCLYCLALPLFLMVRQRTTANLPIWPKTAFKRTINEVTFPVYKEGLSSIFLFTLQQLITWGVYSKIAGVLFEADVPEGLFILFGLLTSFLLLSVFGATGTEGRGACIVNVLALCILLLSNDFPTLLQLLLPMLFATVTALFGLFGTEYPLQTVLNPTTRRWESLCREERGRCFEKFIACVYFFPILLSYSYDDPVGYLLLIVLFGLLFFGASFAFLYRDGKSQRFGDAWKVTLYSFAVFFLFVTSAFLIGHLDVTDVVQQITVLTVLTLCNCVALYSGFRKKLNNPDNSDTPTDVMVHLVHNGLWIWGIALFHSGAVENHPFLCVWLLLLTLFLCGSGMYEQYNRYRDKQGLGIYFGLRVTLYMIVILTAFDGIPGYVISCVLLLLAVLAVLTGFPLRLAPLRIYGLCLAMFAVVKLLMIDVEHDNSMETVLCFLGAGILCFVINYIYNHVKKRFQNNID